MFLICVSLVGSASGIVLHSGSGEPWDRPNNAVVVRWSSNASAAAIGPSWLLTTRHQNTSPATVVIDGATYHCVYHENWNGGQAGNADIRLVKLLDDAGEDAQLSNFAQIYTGLYEAGQYIVMGGYGMGRGVELRTNYDLYGYEWDGSANTTLRWGSNKVIGFGTGGGEYTSDVITADFDGPGEGDATQYEGAVAEYDSGGGWFIKTDSIWKVAGLSRGVEHGLEGESWFRNKDKPRQFDPDYLDAIRVSSYADWILEKTTDPVCTLTIPGDINNDCKINMLDLADFLTQWMRNDCGDVSNCKGADMEPDGDVDLVDFAILTGNWLECRLEPIEACDY
ncbi:MAG: dockerin type I repeat-containing protein [Sedimentisphaerales bacterium]|nr:dockerin type I repeat-containing protein [Sedimentisphaerales bacterium]